MIRIESFQFGYHTPLASEFTDSWDSGLYLLFGSNGSGKSTLLETLSGLRVSLSGSVRYESRSSQARLVGHFPQAPLFGFYPSVEEYLRSSIRLGRLASESDFEREVKSWNLENLLSRNPQILSGGEQQRVHLARFFMTPRNIYLLDEPHQGLDFRFQTQLNLKLQELKRTAVVVYSYHLPCLHLETLDWVLMLGEGSLTRISAQEPSKLVPFASNLFQTKFQLLNGWLLST